MVKHTQTIRWLKPTNCLNVFDHFMGLALKGLLKKEKEKTMNGDQLQKLSQFCSLLFKFKEKRSVHMTSSRKTDVVLVTLFHIFHILFCVFIVDIEQVDNS